MANLQGYACAGVSHAPTRPRGVHEGSTGNLTEPEATGADTWLAYMDMLGYKDKVLKAEQEGTLDKFVATVEAAMDEAIGRDKENLGWEVRILSDSIILGLEKNDAIDVFSLLNMLVFVQAYFAFEGFTIRGAVASGWHYDSAPVIVSPALIRAHQAESTIALYPRIILTDEIRRELALCAEEEGKAYARGPYLTSDIVWVDDDGQTFINYLSIFESCEYPHEKFRCLEMHKSLVDREISDWRGDPRIFTKLRWLAQYHNRFCTKMLAEGVRDPYLVDITKLRQPWDIPAVHPITYERLEQWRVEEDGF